MMNIPDSANPRVVIIGGGFGAVGVGFFAIAWVFDALKR